jgi:hypothetical protein
VRQREAPGFDQLADVGEHVKGAAGIPLAEPHSMFFAPAKSRFGNDPSARGLGAGKPRVFMPLADGFPSSAAAEHPGFAFR